MERTSNVIHVEKAMMFFGAPPSQEYHMPGNTPQGLAPPPGSWMPSVPLNQPEASATTVADPESNPSAFLLQPKKRPRQPEANIAQSVASAPAMGGDLTPPPRIFDPSPVTPEAHITEIGQGIDATQSNYP